MGRSFRPDHAIRPYPSTGALPTAAQTAGRSTGPIRTPGQPPQPTNAFTTNVTGLASNATYYYRFSAANASGTVWTGTSVYLHDRSDRRERDGQRRGDGACSGVFTISRPITATNEAVTVNYTIGGTAVAGVDYVNNLGASIVIPRARLPRQSR